MLSHIFIQMRIHCHMQRMGGINDIVLSHSEQYLITVGQDKRIVVWDNKKTDPAMHLFLDEERDEGLAIAM
jgi:hypothetical protein